MHKTVLQVVSYAEPKSGKPCWVHEAYAFEGPTRKASVSKALRAAESWWGTLTSGTYAEFAKISETDICDSLLYLRLWVR